MPAQTVDELRSHEQRRWSYMTVSQLATRLGRIRNPDKLACFIGMAFQIGGRDSRLERLAWVRAEELGIRSRVRTTLGAYNIHFTEQEVRTPYEATPWEPDYSERSERIRRESARRNNMTNHARSVRDDVQIEVEQARPAANDIHPILGYGEPEQIDAQTHLLGNWDEPDIEPEPDTKPEPKKKVKRRVIRFKRRARQLQLKSILNEE